MSSDTPAGFVRGNDRLAAYLTDPEIREDVAHIRVAMAAEDDA
ncbi:hypothetical protein [Cellulomonas oligotrophica]|uniref:Uncharacterized protein n=1 Tax=Cellulomonas oligotrophica TaxID=931536 RepID=A0A7Y9FHV1_9CELL|nr:hypothetical protein [Cellulomonas oligotrophica]NYD87357.1 hypothetical protein [Cellulomonas oligotrophica]GIG34555.1 hypothetical protein Col01nite_37140 [Cellulomonas oligotrophica]